MDIIKALIEFFQNADVLRLLLFIFAGVCLLLLNNDRIRRVSRHEENKAKAEAAKADDTARHVFQGQMVSLVSTLIDINSKFSGVVEGNTKALTDQTDTLTKQNEKLEILNRTNERQLDTMKEIKTESSKTADRVQGLADETVRLNNDLQAALPGVLNDYHQKVNALLTEGRQIYRSIVLDEAKAVSAQSDQRHKETRDMLEKHIKETNSALMESLPNAVAQGISPEIAKVLAAIEDLRAAVLDLAKSGAPQSALGSQ